MTSGSLNARRRERELAELAAGERVDVVVVGGGVTGTGIALDAASRGLSVALVEAQDLAFGTSRWSSKLVHGGLRYLAHGEFGLAHESAVERGILMTRTAPHLTRAMPQLFPLYPSASRAQQALVAAGLRAGDGLRRAARHAVVGAAAAAFDPCGGGFGPGSRAFSGRPTRRLAGLRRRFGRRRAAGGFPGPDGSVVRRPDLDAAFGFLGVRGPGARPSTAFRVTRWTSTRAR